MKSDRRTAHSRLVSGDEHGRGPSRSSRGSSDHGRSSQGRRSRSREPTPPQLINFNIDDFTVVSHTTDSFTFTSAHPFFPGWVRVVSAHREVRVRNIPCTHNPAEEQRARRRVRRDVEPPEVRKFLRQELLKKVGHSWWNRPRDYCHDLADEREQFPVEESAGGRPDRPGDEDLEARQRHCCSYHRLLLLSDSFSSVLREGVPRGTRGGDTPPAFSSLWQLGQLVRRTRRRDVHGHNVPLGTSVDTRNKLTHEQ